MCLFCFAQKADANSIQTANDGPELSAKFCKRNKIYCAILKLRPEIIMKFAMDLSSAIYKYSKRSKVDPFRVVAIAIKRVRCRRLYVTKQSELEDHMRRKVCVVRYVKEKELQIVVFTFRKNCKNAWCRSERLMADLDYATKVHAVLSYEAEAMLLKIKNMQACYNSTTLKST